MRSEGYCSWVCVSVKSHLTYGASVHPENAVTYSVGNEGQKICGVFSETAPLQRSSTPSIVRPCVQSAIFPAESTHAHLVWAPSVFPSRCISAAARLFAFATSCPAQRGKADVPVRFTCWCCQSARNWLCWQVYTARGPVSHRIV